MATARTVVFVIKCDHTSTGWGWGGTIPSKVGEAGTVLVLWSPGGGRLLLASLGRQAPPSLKSWARQNSSEESPKEVAPWHVQITVPVDILWRL